MFLDRGGAKGFIFLLGAACQAWLHPLPYPEEKGGGLSRPALGRTSRLEHGPTLWGEEAEGRPSRKRK